MTLMRGIHDIPGPVTFVKFYWSNIVLVYELLNPVRILLVHPSRIHLTVF